VKVVKQAEHGCLIAKIKNQHRSWIVIMPMRGDWLSLQYSKPTLVQDAPHTHGVLHPGWKHLHRHTAHISLRYPAARRMVHMHH